MTNKYQPLELYLRGVDPDTTEITISFSGLEAILGAALPASALAHRAWWGNQKNTLTRPQARAWLSAGFVVDGVFQDREHGWVRFRCKGAVEESNLLTSVLGTSEPRLVPAVNDAEINLEAAGSKIFLVSCVSKKRERPSPARDLYVSDWFMKARAYVERFRMPWFILSAKYGLVAPETTIAPYNLTLRNMTVKERRSWAARVIAQMESMLPSADCVVVLAGLPYREFLMDYLRRRFASVQVPMEGLEIGKQLHWLGQH